MEASYEYLSYMAGPVLVYPQVVIEQLTGGHLLPISYPQNYFSNIGRDEACQVPENYQKAGLECNILANYGDGIIVILFFVFASLVITSVNAIVSWRDEAKTSSYKQYDGVLNTDLDKQATVKAKPSIGKRILRYVV